MVVPYLRLRMPETVEESGACGVFGGSTHHGLKVLGGIQDLNL